MTLLVAEVGRSHVWMLADTAITDPAAGPRTPQQFRPKIEAVQGKGLIGFAGDAHHGQRIMLAACALQPGDAVLRTLLAGHRDCPSVDFAQACLGEDGAPQLYRIASGSVERVATLHMGSQDAFGTFQGIRHSAEIGHAPEALHTLIVGMRDATDVPDRLQASIASMFQLFVGTSDRDVGGWPVPYMLDANGAGLCTYGYSVSDPILGRLAPGSLIPHGTAEAGGFGLSLTELRERDGMVMYWLQRPGGRILVRTESGYDEFDFEGPPTAFKERVHARLGREVDI